MTSFNTSSASSQFTNNLDSAFFPEGIDNLISGLRSNAIKTLNFQALDFNIYDVDTTSGPILVTMVPTPVDGSRIYFSNTSGSFSVNNCTLQSVQKINGSFGSFVCSSSKGIYECLYDFTNSNWNICQLNIGGGGGSFLSSNLQSGRVYVGDVTNVGVAVALSGDLNLSNAGVTSVQPNAISNAKLAQAGARTWKGNNSGATGNQTDNTAASITESVSSVLTLSAANSVLNPVTVQVKQANTTQDGFLSSTDWNTFNGKQTSALTSGSVFVGNASNVATATTLSGDVSVTNAGVTSVQPNAISNAKLAQAGARTWKGNNSGVTGNQTDNSLSTLNEVASNILTITGTNNLVNPGSIQVKRSNAGQGGYLDSTDWIAFDAKQNLVASAVNNNIVVSNVSGQGVDSGKTFSTDGAFASNSDDFVPTVKAAKTYADTRVPISQLGVANGVATLNGSGQITSSQVPSSLLGVVVYQGTWNASTNTPTLVSSVGTKGFYYLVSVAGNTSLDGISSWLVNDMAIFNGSDWDKIIGTNSVTSVNSLTGTVSLTSNLIPEGITNLYYTDTRGRNTPLTIYAPSSGTITTADSFQSAFNKIGGSLNTTAGQVIVGNASNVATATTLSGDVSVTNTGVTSVQPNAISNAKLAQAGARTWKGNNSGATGNQTDNTAASITESVSSVLTLSAANSVLNPVTVQVKQANTTQDGFLSSTDWNTFNNASKSTKFANAVSVNNIAGTYTSGVFTDMPNTAIDGYSLVVGSVILLPNQTFPRQNGLYTVTSVGTGIDGVWNRLNQINRGTIVYVETGTVYQNSIWKNTNYSPITIGVDFITFVQSSETDILPDVQQCSTVNIATLSGTQSVDGINTAATTLVLLQNQTTPSQNGIWYIPPSNGAWVRPPFFTGVVPAGLLVGVRLSGGLANDGLWQIRNGTTPTSRTISVNVDNISVAQLASSSSQSAWNSRNAAGGDAVYDSNRNLYANSLVNSVTSTVTAVGTTTLTLGSTQIQRFTGTSTQTVVLPNATSLPVGTQFVLQNESTNSLTLQNATPTTLSTISGGSDTTVTLSTNGTVAGVWHIQPVASVSSSTVPSSNTISRWDTNSNLSANNFFNGIATTVTTGGTTTLTVASPQTQLFTGTQSQQVTLPNATTLANGHTFVIKNASALDVTIQMSGSGTIASLGTLSETTVTLSSNATVAGTWNVAPFARSTPFANIPARWDQNTNFLANNFIPAIQTIVTSGGATAISLQSQAIQRFTGSSSHTLSLPNATNANAGLQFLVMNESTGTLTVNNGAAVLLASVPTLTDVLFTLAVAGSVGGTWHSQPLTGSGSSVPFANTIARWDANTNLVANNFVSSVTTTVTSAGNLSLLITSPQVQRLTGSAAHTVALPNSTSANVGLTFTFLVETSGIITIKNFDATTLTTLPGLSSFEFTLVANGTQNGTWSFRRLGLPSPPTAGGILTSNSLNNPAWIGSGVQGARVMTGTTGLPVWQTTNFVVGNTSTGTNITSTSYTSTGLSCTITPTYSTSKIQLQAFFNFYNNGGTNTISAFFAFGKNGTVINSSGDFQVLVPNVGGVFTQSCNLMIVDAPASTAAQTYAVFARVSGGTSVFFNSGSLVTTITALEII